MRRGWVRAARIGQAAWLAGNVYESVVGMPELLADASGRRRPGVFAPGSPVRFYALTAPLGVGSTARVLLEHARRGDDRRLVVAAGAGFAAALAVTAGLVRTASFPLLTASGPLDNATRQRLRRRWHGANAVRVGCVLAGTAAFAALTSSES